MTKEVRKAIIIRLKLRNKFLKDKNEQSRNDYRKQRNLCAALVRRAKQQYFCGLDLSLIVDDKKFFGKESNPSSQTRFLIKIQLV